MSSIVIEDSPSQTTYSISITQWIWFDLILISVGARKAKTRPKIGWPPWVTRVLELKHLEVYALQHKLGDPFPQERADRSAARSMAWPARRRALWVVLEVKRTQIILWPCDVGLGILVIVESHLSEMCILHVKETTTYNIRYCQ